MIFLLIRLYNRTLSQIPTAGRPLTLRNDGRVNVTYKLCVTIPVTARGRGTETVCSVSRFYTHLLVSLVSKYLVFDIHDIVQILLNIDYKLF